MRALNCFVNKSIFGLEGTLRKSDPGAHFTDGEHKMERGSGQGGIVYSTLHPNSTSPSASDPGQVIGLAKKFV